MRSEIDFSDLSFTPWNFTELLVPSPTCSATFLIVNAVRFFLKTHLYVLIGGLHVALINGISVLTVPALLATVVATLGILLGATLPNLLLSTLAGVNCLASCLTSGPSGTYCESLALLVGKVVQIVNFRVLTYVINALTALQVELSHPIVTIFDLTVLANGIDAVIVNLIGILSESNLALLDANLQETVHALFESCCIKRLSYHP